MGTHLKSDVEAIKYKMIRKEELTLFKEYSGSSYVVRLLPLHLPLEETVNRVYTSTKSLYHQLYHWVQYEMGDGIYSSQINLQVQTKDMYYVIGVDVLIEKLSEPDETTFTSFADDESNNMNYLQSFSLFK